MTKLLGQAQTFYRKNDPNLQVQRISPLLDMKYSDSYRSTGSHLPDLNRGPSLYKSVALPTELRWRLPTLPHLHRFENHCSLSLTDS